MQIKVDFAFAVGALVLGGCGTFVEATALNAPPRTLTPRPADAVEVYSSSPPTKPHVDVALIQADQINGMQVELPEMIAKLREKAGQMGCDAIFISGDSERAGAPGDAHLFDPGSHQLLATCIAYLESTPVPARRAVTVPPQVSSAAPVTASFVVSSPAHRLLRREIESHVRAVHAALHAVGGPLSVHLGFVLFDLHEEFRAFVRQSATLPRESAPYLVVWRKVSTPY